MILLPLSVCPYGVVALRISEMVRFWPKQAMRDPQYMDLVRPCSDSVGSLGANDSGGLERVMMMIDGLLPRFWLQH